MILYKKFAIVLTAGLFLHACTNTSTMDTDSAATDEQAAAPGVHRQQAPRQADAPFWDNTQEATDDLLAPVDVWQRIRLGLAFSEHYDHEQVVAEREWYAGHEDFLVQVSERASPFLYEIVEEIERRGLPMELALLPAVESAYNPTATSSQQAVGLWQFMSATGRSLGLKQDWWYDGRRDPLASTSAALDYLESLYQLFDNDWLLALAAYNVGQGNLQRAISNNERQSRATDFWSLTLPRETRNHISRLLGLAQLVADPSLHDMEFPAIANAPAVVSVDVGQQIDLALAAQMAGLETEVIYRLNPGFRQWATHPDGPYHLLVPVSHAEDFTSALESLPATAAVTWDRYVIQRGDTLGSIARKFRTQVAMLQEVNGMNSTRIIAGDSLLIPRAYTAGMRIAPPNVLNYADNQSLTPDSFPVVTYQVRRGDTLSAIARRYNVSLADITSWNNIDVNNVLRLGQQLRIQQLRAEASTD